MEKVIKKKKSEEKIVKKIDTYILYCYRRVRVTNIIFKEQYQRVQTIILYYVLLHNITILCSVYCSNMTCYIIYITW